MNPYLEQLSQLRTATWDGNLISKEIRTALVQSGLAQRHMGFNWLTEKGVETLVNLGILTSQWNLLQPRREESSGRV